MSDVAAVVVTVGEKTTSRALASLAAQTLQVEEVCEARCLRGPASRSACCGIR